MHHMGNTLSTGDLEFIMEAFIPVLIRHSSEATACRAAADHSDPGVAEKVGRRYVL